MVNIENNIQIVTYEEPIIYYTINMHFFNIILLLLLS